MGSELCSGVPDEDQLEKIDYNPDEEHPDEEINKIIRKGVPSQHVAYNINNLPDFLKESAELTKKQQQIAKLMAHEKKNVKPMNISKNANDKNYLPDPYYIRSMDAVYVGEWVLDKEINQVVPGGLGRLYTEERIIEGEIVTKVMENATFFDADNLDFTQKMVSHNKEKASFFALNKNVVEQVVAQHRFAYDDQQFLKIKVLLQGEGRSFTRNSQLRGIFVDGEISGKGYLRIKDGEDVYQYTGQFKNGKKNGKGIQKFKLTTYDGDFQNDQKKGKGTLTLFISKAYEKERLQEDGKLAIQDKQKQPSQKILKVKDFVKQKNIFEHKLNEELKKYYKWLPPKYPPKSMTENQNFVIQHNRRIKFLEYYKGDFDANLFHGHGTYTWFNGKCYNGEWHKGQMQGIGEFYWPKGIIYRGQYEKDNRHGKGEMIWGLEKRFRGSWAYGLRHGYGELIEVVQASKKRSEQFLAATQAQDNQKLKQIKEEELQQQKQEQECKREKVKRVKKYYLRVIGALFDKDKIAKQFFKKFTLIEVDLRLQQLITLEKEMIAFVKDIKIDHHKQP